MKCKDQSGKGTKKIASHGRYLYAVTSLRSSNINLSRLLTAKRNPWCHLKETLPLHSFSNEVNSFVNDMSIPFTRARALARAHAMCSCHLRMNWFHYRMNAVVVSILNKIMELFFTVHYCSWHYVPQHLLVSLKLKMKIA